MSKHVLEVAELRRNRAWSYAAPSRLDRGARDRVRWWPASLPASLPGSDHDDPAPRPRPARRPIRRGRIQFAA